MDLKEHTHLLKKRKKIISYCAVVLLSVNILVRPACHLNVVVILLYVACGISKDSTFLLQREYCGTVIGGLSFLYQMMGLWGIKIRGC